MKPIIVLGSGLAGYTLVRELRKLNSDFRSRWSRATAATTTPSPCCRMPLRRTRMQRAW